MLATARARGVCGHCWPSWPKSGAVAGAKVRWFCLLFVQYFFTAEDAENGGKESAADWMANCEFMPLGKPQAGSLFGPYKLSQVSVASLSLHHGDYYLRLHFARGVTSAVFLRR